MFILITYDIDIEGSGAKRLHKVAKICQNYGVRVQKSVFELQILFDELLKLESELKDVIDEEKDSIRIYNLGNSKRKNQIQVIGKKEKIELSSDDAFLL
jgi:CRISPR-associated protein Cas2